MAQQIRIPNLSIGKREPHTAVERGVVKLEVRIATAPGRIEKDPNSGEIVPVSHLIANEILAHFRELNLTSRMCLALSQVRCHHDGKQVFELSGWVLTVNQRRQFYFTDMYTHSTPQFTLYCESDEFLKQICQHFENLTTVDKHVANHDNVPFTVWRYL